jgi:hypothetical protein
MVGLSTSTQGQTNHALAFCHYSDIIMVALSH